MCSYTVCQESRVSFDFTSQNNQNRLLPFLHWRSCTLVILLQSALVIKIRTFFRHILGFERDWAPKIIFEEIFPVSTRKNLRCVLTSIWKPVLIIDIAPNLSFIFLSLLIVVGLNRAARYSTVPYSFHHRTFTHSHPPGELDMGRAAAHLYPISPLWWVWICLIREGEGGICVLGGA